MITIKSTSGNIRINEGVNTALRGDYNLSNDEKWIAFKTKHNLKITDDMFKWHDLYLQLCAAGLL